jgi:hypothetical protein
MIRGTEALDELELTGLASPVNAGTAPDLESVDMAVVVPLTEVASEVVRDEVIEDNMEPVAGETCTVELPIGVRVEGNWKVVRAESLGT